VSSRPRLAHQAPIEAKGSRGGRLSGQHLPRRRQLHERGHQGQPAAPSIHWDPITNTPCLASPHVLLPFITSITSTRALLESARDPSATSLAGSETKSDARVLLCNSGRESYSNRPSYRQYLPTTYSKSDACPAPPPPWRTRRARHSAGQVRNPKAPAPKKNPPHHRHQ